MRVGAAAVGAGVAVLAALLLCRLPEPLLRLCLGGRSTTQAHQDPSRASVGWTAFGVALLVRACVRCVRVGRAHLRARAGVLAQY